MKALIFGANGQDGFYLTRLLEQNTFEVIGISRHGNFIHGDVSDYNLVKKLVNQHQPEFIFHLAANSTTKYEALFENHNTIVTGSINILEAVRTFSPKTKIFLSGSGLQFKNEGNPIKETNTFDANSAYSMSRIQSVYAARYYRTLEIKVYVGYFFNHESPRRTERHVTKKISEAAKRIAAGSSEKLEIGDISTIKEYSYAGDIVEGVWALVNQDKVWEANISSGKGYSIKDWLEQCFSLFNKRWEDHVILKAGFIADYQKLVSDPSVIFSLGWQPKVSFEQLAKMMVF
jgi:GDPmannose 4,6-dehydratase